MAENDNDEAQTQHQLTQAQLEAIEHEIKATQPLTSPLLPISVLSQQYTTTNNDETNKNDGGDRQQQQQQQQQQQGFLQSAKFLSKKYNSLRKIRGDGNCYYRAFLYSLCEHLLRSLLDNNNNSNNNNSNSSGYEEFARLKKIVQESLKWVCQYGYDEYTIDMFYEELVELFDFIEEAYCKKKQSETSDDDCGGNALLENALKELHTKLNEENASSDYCTWFLRVITSAQMKSAPDDQYLPFVMAENYADVISFCSREVEPMGKECGMVQVSALAACLGVRVVVEYMDGRVVVGTNDKSGSKSGGDEVGRVVSHVFGVADDGDEETDDDDDDDDGRTCVTLLYRPGHYDILY